MSQPISLPKNTTPKDLLGLLEAIYPIEGLVCVGAVDSELMHSINSLTPANAVYIDSHENNIVALQKRGQLAGWTTTIATLADQAGTRPYHHYSLPVANGITPLDQVQRIWPNIKLEGTEHLECTTLDEYLKQSANQSAIKNWLVLNGIDATAQLRGADTSLDAFDVLIVLQHGSADLARPSNQDNSQTSFIKLSAELPCRQPMLTVAVYMKDWKSQTRIQERQLTQQHAQETNRLGQSIAAKEQQSAKYLQEIQNLTATRQGLEKQAQERLNQIQMLTLERDQNHQKTEEAKHSSAQLTKQLAELQQQAQQQHAQNKSQQEEIEKLAKERDEERTHSQQLQAQIANMKQDLSDSESQREKLHQQISALEGNKTALSKQVEMFENQLEFLKSFINGS